jgi:ABC-three component (ABC-3C) system Middle Component 5
MFRSVAQMSQLVFQPSLDPFHAVFRFLRLRTLFNVENAVSRDHSRILDFYLLFPFLIRSIRLAPKHQKYKKLADKYAFLKPYGEQPDGSVMLQRMDPMQSAALETLASQSYLDTQALQHDVVAATDRKIPAQIQQRVYLLNEGQADLLEFLTVLAKDYDILGDNGLKARTGLMEHRYDAV